MSNGEHIDRIQNTPFTPLPHDTLIVAAHPSSCSAHHPTAASTPAFHRMPATHRRHPHRPHRRHDPRPLRTTTPPRPPQRGRTDHPPQQTARSRTVKPCLDCGEPSHTTRCEQHRLPEPPKPSAASRGYNNAWTRLSKRARRLQPFCTSCGATEDLQADHSPEAWARKAAGLPIRLQDIDVVCGTCNRSRGAARGYAPNRAVQDPIGKARSALHTPRRCV